MTRSQRVALIQFPRDRPIVWWCISPPRM